MDRNDKHRQMKKFTIRDVETVKTTAALYAIWMCIGRPPIPL